MDRRKLAIGFLLYGDSTARYLEYFLPSLLAAIDNCGLDTIIMAWDNGPRGFVANRQFLDAYPEIVLMGNGVNDGFAKANNALISAASEAGATYFLALNPDTLLAPDALQELLRALESNISLASVSPKLLRWDFAHKQPTQVIDTCGIVLNAGLQFRDLGQAELDQGQYDQVEILGPSGCAALYRLSALARVRDEHGYFDERFFMYKEDCDLAYRLRVSALASALVPTAIIYHDRSASNNNFSLWGRLLNMRYKSKQVQAWSFYGDWLIFFKHWPTLKLPDRLAAIFYRLLALAYALVFNRQLLVEITKAKQVSKI